ncbi:MAG: hypothetical protein L6R36_009220 [Xanthoria steineri]|nr:MAG: hypothetical protein L6R36_009220 [Xanthoria steineri]
MMESLCSRELPDGTFSDFWKAEFDANIPYTEGPFLLKEVWQEDLPQSGYSGLDLCLDVFADQPSGSVLISTAVPYVNLNDSVPNVNSEKVILPEDAALEAIMNIERKISMAPNG